MQNASLIQHIALQNSNLEHLLTTYLGEDVHIFDNYGRVFPNWNWAWQASNSIILVLQQNRRLLASSRTQEDKQKAIDKLWIEIQQVVTGFDKSQAFLKLAPMRTNLENTLLIFYLLLTLSWKKNRTNQLELLLETISLHLVPMLDNQNQQNNQNKSHPNQKFKSVPQFDFDSYTQKVDAAVIFSNKLDISGGLVTTQNPQVQAIIDKSYEVIKDIKTMKYELAWYSFFAFLLNVGLLLNTSVIFIFPEAFFTFLDPEDYNFSFHSLAIIAVTYLITVKFTIPTLLAFVYNLNLKRYLFFNLVNIQSQIKYENENFKGKKESIIKIFQLIFIIAFLLGLLGAGIRQENTHKNRANMSGSALSIPESFPRELLGDIPFTLQGEIHHLPESIKLDQGEILGYQPAMYFHGEQVLNSSSRTPFIDVVLIETNQDPDVLHQPDDLVYEFLNLNSEVIVPLDEYRFKRIYQSGSSTPEIDEWGRLVYPPGELPKRIITVQERQQWQPIVEGLYQTPLIGQRYELEIIGYPIPSMETILPLLRADRELYTLYSEYLSEITDLNARLNNNQVTNDQFAGDYSEIALNQHIELLDIIYNQRNYSLLFESNSHLYPNIPFFTLIDVANQPDAGFYCVVADKTVWSFHESAGVRVFSRPGHYLFYFDGKVYSRIGHTKNFLHLPNGEIYSTDATPINPNPGEDFSMLENPSQPENGQNIWFLVSFLVIIALGGKLAAPSIKKSIRQKFEAVLLNQQEGQFEVLKAASHAAIYASEPNAAWPTRSGEASQDVAKLTQEQAQQLARECILLSQNTKSQSGSLNPKERNIQMHDEKDFLLKAHKKNPYFRQNIKLVIQEIKKLDSNTQTARLIEILKLLSYRWSRIIL